MKLSVALSYENSEEAHRRETHGLLVNLIRWAPGTIRSLSFDGLDKADFNIVAEIEPPAQGCGDDMPF